MGSVGVIWALLVGGAVFSGATFCAVLVVPPKAEPPVAVLGLAGFGASSYALVTLSGAYGRIDAILYAFAFMVAAAAGGWSLASSVLERLAATPAALELPSELPEGQDGIAVVLVSCIEPARYHPSSTAVMLHSLAEEGLVQLSLGTLPFVYFAQKTRYRAIGGMSPARSELDVLGEALKPLLDSRVTSVETATCSGKRRLTEQVLRAAQVGYRTIVVAELDIGSPVHLVEAKRDIDVLRLEDHGITIAYTEPLADSDRIISMVSHRILHVVDHPTSTGVILVGQGQPDPRSRRNPSMDENETAFLNRLRIQLTDAGIESSHIRISWLEWTAADVTSSVRHLAALGCTRIVVSPAVYPVDTIATRLDLELAVRQARIEENIVVVTLPAWREDDVVLAELAERIHAELD